MTQSIYVGVDNKAKKVKLIYVGVDGVARKVKKVYIGDANGKAQLCYNSINIPTEETVLWRGGIDGAFTITIPAGVNVLKITTENSYINNFVDPRLPRYVGVTPGKTYNMGWAYVVEGAVPEPEYFEVWVQRRNSSSDHKTWVSSYAGDAPEGAGFTYVDIIMSYSASINQITPNVTDY